MMPHANLRRSFIWAVSLFLAGAAPALAFNPQPEPPGSWSIEGFIDLTANQYNEAFAGSRPFGLTAKIAMPDGQPAFTIALHGIFAAEGDTQPVPGRHQGVFEAFNLEIGSAKWTSADVTELAFEIMNNNPHVYVTGATTDPDHPILELFLPSSPGTWRAIDIVNGDNHGSISGTYVLRDAKIPEPATITLMVLGLACLTCWSRWRSGRRRRV